MDEFDNRAQYKVLEDYYNTSASAHFYMADGVEDELYHQYLKAMMFNDRKLATAYRLLRGLLQERSKLQAEKGTSYVQT